MSAFRAGTFDRNRVPGFFRAFCPSEARASLLDVDPAALVERGIKLVLLDVDNTLLPWRGEEIPEDSRGWIERGKQAGLKFCIVSNTRNRERLSRLGASLGAPFARGRFKPSQQMFLQALKDAGVMPTQAVMIGDQLMTDILGGNRAGVQTIWVRRMSDSEFFGTRINRFFESLIHRNLLEVMEAEGDDLPGAPRTGLLRHKVVRQFLKFAIVGGSSFVIDYCLRMTLLFAVPWHGGLLSDHFGAWLRASFPALTPFAQSNRDAAVPIFVTLSSLVAMVNSFIWNRKWTFNIHGRELRNAQLRRFFVISIVGVLLNATLTTALSRALGGAGEKPALRIATILATLVVAIWNFMGQRLYAFRVEEK